MNNFGFSYLHIPHRISIFKSIFQRRSVPTCGDVTCVNGCCKNITCQNGGTCIEICEPASVRYNCSCAEKFIGRHCEFERKSCQAIKLQEKGVLDCTQSLITAVNPSKCFVTFTLSPGLHGA